MKTTMSWEDEGSDFDRKVFSLPMSRFFPIKSKDKPSDGGKRQVDVVNAQPGVLRFPFGGCCPFVRTEANAGRGKGFQP